MSDSLSRLKWLILVPTVALSNHALAETSDSEVELLNQIVFPGSVNAVMKWPKAVRFAIATENDQDAALALKVISDIADSLPGRFQDKIIIERRIPLTDVPSLKERGVIYVKSQPYEDLTSPLRPFFETLITNGEDVDQRIDQARSQEASWQTTIGMNSGHEVVGVLVMIKSSTDMTTKRLMLVGAVSQVVCPAVLLGKTDPGLFEEKGEVITLSQLGKDLFMLMLDDEVRAGMSKAEFSEIARRLH
jgi:hypothetical protein